MSVGTQVLVDGVEADCERDDIEAAVEKACGFALDPSDFEEREIEFKTIIDYGGSAGLPPSSETR